MTQTKWPRPSKETQKLAWDSHSGPYRIPAHAVSDPEPVIIHEDNAGKYFLEGLMTAGAIFIAILMTFGIYIAFFAERN